MSTYFADTEAAAAFAVSAMREKKKLVRRLAPDQSQKIRRIVQGAFLVLNAWIGLQFYLWVRWLEIGGAGMPVSRPAGVEGWLPLAGLVKLEDWGGPGARP